jgi:hypothetical protein
MQPPKHFHLIALLVLVLAIRLGFLALFHRQVFSGPSTRFEQAFVAMNLLDGKGVKIFRDFPPTVEASDPTQMIDPERYEVRSSALHPTSGKCLVMRWFWRAF